MREFRDYADGDVCPQDPAHRRMFFIGPERQWCAHAGHKGLAVYLRDGVTLASMGAQQQLAVAGRPPERQSLGASLR